MNPYRFRAFNREENKFEFFGLGDPALDSATNYAPIEQYTGLPDKKNHRVWEGDIVAIAPFRGPHKGRLAVVKRHSWGWKFEAIESSQYPLQTTYMAPDQYKVVGNIHETPELLNG